MAVKDVIKILKNDEISKKMPASYEIDNTIVSNVIFVISEELNELYQSIIDTEKIEDIDFLFGKSLDLYGEDYFEYRNGAEDDDYKRRIKAIKITYGSLGDEDAIIESLASYFNINNNDIEIHKIGTRKIEIRHPDEFDKNNVYPIARKVKAAGIRFILEKNLFWEDMTYNEIEELTFDKLESYRYERNDKR